MPVLRRPPSLAALLGFLVTIFLLQSRGGSHKAQLALRLLSVLHTFIKKTIRVFAVSTRLAVQVTGTVTLTAIAGEGLRRLLLLQKERLEEELRRANETKSLSLRFSGNPLSPQNSKSKTGHTKDSRGKDGEATELRESLRLAFSAVRLSESGDSSPSGTQQVSVTAERGHEAHLLAFSPIRFQELRRSLGLAEEVYWSSLCDGELTGGMTQASGKSGALFWVSHDKLLVLKTCTRSELSTLLVYLERYGRHFATYKNSLLCRLYGAYEFRGHRQSFVVVVMNNIFAGKFEPHVIYDLKGTTEDRWVNPSPGAVLKDLNFADKVIGISDQKQKTDLIYTLKRDTKFLKEQTVIDYSICLGVHYCDGDSHPPMDELMPSPGIWSPLAVIPGFEPKFQSTLVRDQPSRRVVYFIGIIDVLQRYDVKKAAAYFIKSMSLGWVHEIDTARPADYARRFKTNFHNKVQTFREPMDRVARFVKRLQGGIEGGTVLRPTFARTITASGDDAERSRQDGAGEEVTLDEAIDFAVRCGGQLQLLRRTGWFRSLWEEVEAFLDMDRHALVFQTMSRSMLSDNRPTFVACYKIRRVYLSIACHRPRDRHCQACHRPTKIEAEPVESRRFTVEAEGTALRFTAPSRRQAKLWVTALEVAAGYAEANVEDHAEAACAVAVAAGSSSAAASPHGSPSHCGLTSNTMAHGPPWSARASRVARAAVLGAVEPWLESEDVEQLMRICRAARLGMLEPLLLGPEAHRRWEKRRVKWIFGFMDTEAAGRLPVAKVQSLLREMNINEAESRDILGLIVWEDREGRRAGGGRQLGSGTAISLDKFRLMLQRADLSFSQAVHRAFLDLTGSSSSTPIQTRSYSMRSESSYLQSVSPQELARFFAVEQKLLPRPTPQQVQRLLAFLSPPLVNRGNRGLESMGLAQLLCSPSNALADPAKRPVFQDMTKPLAHYFVETSHNTYLEGNQLSSRSSVLRYVEVLRRGCRSVEVDVWDGAEGEPIVKHGYAVTTEVPFEDVIQAIADHAFVASEYPVIISVEQHCSALQRTRQGEILRSILGERLLLPPWDEKRNEIDYEAFEPISPWSARGRFLVKSSLGCCERCSAKLPLYDQCIALPTKKLQKNEKQELLAYTSLHSTSPQAEASPAEPSRSSCHVSSMNVGKCLKLRDSAGEAALQNWNTRFLSRAYPTGTMIGSGNFDPIPLWLCGVQMVAMNYQTPDLPLLFNDGLFRNFNGGCGYVLKPPELLGEERPCQPRVRRLLLRVCCAHRLPQPEAPITEETGAMGHGIPGSAISSPFVTVSLEPGGQVSQSKPVQHDGYHPVFNHEVMLNVSAAPLHILALEVRDFHTGRPMARTAVSLDALREGLRWVPLQNSLGSTIPHCGLLVCAQFHHGTSDENSIERRRSRS